MHPTTEAIQFAKLLNECPTRFVLAESCTGGLVAASLGAVPGISQWMCGSMVVYRDQTKTDWLGISKAELRQFTSVSKQTTIDMATRTLMQTPEASICAAVTGHLGPNTPQDQNGILFTVIALRAGDETKIIHNSQLFLDAGDRSERQDQAAAVVITVLGEAIQSLAR